MITCGRLEEVRDYAFDELDARARTSLQNHLAECEECGAELDRLQLTTAALRILPEREIPRRIAFISDRKHEPKAGWFTGFWNSASRLGFASAAVLATGLIVSSYHPATQDHPLARVAPAVAAQVDISKQVDEAVAKAVAQVRAEDAKILQATMVASEKKHEQEHHALLVAMDENMTILQKRLSTYTMLASNDSARPGGGQQP